MKRWAAVMLAIWALAGVAGAKTTLTVGLDSDPPNLDPLLSSALVDRQVQNQIFDKLVDLDENLKVVPMLAQSWSVEENGTAYVFKLRPGVKFHDGTEFNAAAVKFNLDRYRTAQGSRRAGELASVREVQVVDNLTVKVILKEPFAPLLAILSDRSGMMVSPTAAQKLGADFGASPVGSGPFKFVERRRQDRITLAKNENYWMKGFPKVDELVYRPFPDDDVRTANLLSGAVNLITPVAPKDLDSIRKNPNLSATTFAGIGYQGIYLNVNKGPLANKALRQAFAATIDRETVDKVVFLGTAQPSNGAFPPSSFAFDKSIPAPKPDLELAKKKLAEGGKPQGFSFTLTIAPGPVLAQLAQVYQAMAAQVGIQVKIEQVEFGTLLDRGTKGDFEALAVGWSGRPDPDGNIYDFVRCKGPQNYAGYCNPKVDTLLNRARSVRLPEARRDLYSQVMKIVLDDLPYVYIYHPQTTIGLSKRVSGIPAIPDGILRFRAADLGE
ncbi:MAG: peptide ABC transporter substrate-binding protein [Meiothermus sp.]